MLQINIRRILILIIGVLLINAVSMAQSAADKAYNDGLRFQKTMTIQAQNSAIAKFQGAKKLYDSAAKKAQCDQAISVSVSIKNSLASGKVNKKKVQRNNDSEEEEVKVKEKTLSLSNSEFSLENVAKQLTVTVDASDDNWEVSVTQPKTGSSFVTAKRTGANSVSIDVERNKSYRTRTQVVNVKMDDLERTILINQSGQEANIEADPLKLEFKTNGQTKEMMVYCDSDEEYDDNSGCNWFIVSQPEWINVVVDNGGKDSLGEKAKKFGKAVTGIFKKNKKYPENMLPTKVLVQCLELTKAAGSDYHNGRSEYLIIGSGDKEIKVLIMQKGKK